MKKILLLLALFLTFGCYDDSEIRGELREYEARLATLEKLCQQANSNIEALQMAVSALEKNVYVSAIVPVKKNGEEIGYAISFTNAETITIYHGQDGANGEKGNDGVTPVIGLRRDTDGTYYWTLNGEWLLDDSGNKVPASGKDGADGLLGASGPQGAAGKDGMTPTLKIVDGYWYVSYDGGKTWEEETLGQATGDNGYTMFEKVEYDQEYVYITMTGGEKLTLPRTSAGQGGAGPLTWSLDKVTEISATFSGILAIPAADLPFSQVMVYYSDAEKFNINDALEVSITEFDADHKFTITITGLKTGVKYNYCLIAEVKSKKIYDEIKSFTTTSVVAPSLNAAQEVTNYSAIISGKVTLPSETTSDLEYGFEYCVSPDFASSVVTKIVTDLDSEKNFSEMLTQLTPLTTYYYRSYIKMNGAYGNSEIKSFTTESLVAPELSSVSEIKYSSAKISGKAKIPPMYIDDLDEAIATSRLQVGVLYSKYSPLSYEKSAVNESMPVKDNETPEMWISELAFDAQIVGLSPETTYYYCSYVYLDGQVVLGEENTFTTLPDPYHKPTDLNISSAVDVSSSTSANCYIISESGLYKFKTVKGNSTASIGNVASASILWETFGTSETPEFFALIKSFCYKDGYIAFQTADTFKEGNAVIAAKDLDGNILWSWHIWFTDQPSGQEYYNNAGTMMDRNLGATSATPGDVGALGLIYQWGRKDPFLNSSSISGTTETPRSIEAKSTITWPLAVSTNSSRGTESYVTANPTVYVCGASSTNYDWHYSSRDNTLWTTSDKPKSIYDPCPAGWRVPDGGSNGAWSKALGSSDDFTHHNIYDSSNGGSNFSGVFGNAFTIWYPASGYRYYYDGGLYGVGNYGGCYWSASPDNDRAYNLFFIYSNGHVYPSSDDYRAYGCSVRCLQESK